MRGTCPMCSVLQILGYDDYHQSLGIHSIRISLEDFNSLFDYYFINVSKYTFFFACPVFTRLLDMMTCLSGAWCFLAPDL